MLTGWLAVEGSCCLFPGVSGTHGRGWLGSKAILIFQRSMSSEQCPDLGDTAARQRPVVTSNLSCSLTVLSSFRSLIQSSDGPSFCTDEEVEVESVSVFEAAQLIDLGTGWRG
jgi:hypothetical protein